LRALLERLGPSFVKLGQMMSLRADLVGEDLAQALAKLQSDVAPFPSAEARRVVYEELGKYPEALFKSFEERPVAAGSLAQVHRAVLDDGTEVAVKIQRPGIRETITSDIHILAHLAQLAERFAPELRGYQPVRLVREFADWTLRELDFATEGHHADRFRHHLRAQPAIVIPRVYWGYTAERVLTMDFMHGVKADDLAGMERLGTDRRALARVGVETLFQQFFIDGFFHADPHPGNFFALSGDRLCLHDFGMVGYLDQSQRKELVSCFVAVVNRDVEGFLRHLLHLATVTEQSDLAGFTKDVAGILSGFLFSDDQPSVAWLFLRVIGRGAERNVRFSADLALFGRALVTTEGMGRKIYPEFDFNRELAPYVNRAYREYLNPRRLVQTLQSDLFDYVEFVKTLPERTQRVLERLDRGEIGVKLDTDDLRDFKRELDRQNDLRLLGTLIVVIFLATVLLLYQEGRTAVLGLPLSSWGVSLFGALLAWFLLKLRGRPE
jgi:ubiquinone biosynthesis protein